MKVVVRAICKSYVVLVLPDENNGPFFLYLQKWVQLGLNKGYFHPYMRFNRGIS